MVATEVEQLAGGGGSGSGKLVFHSTMRWCVCVCVCACTTNKMAIHLQCLACAMLQGRAEC